MERMRAHTKQRDKTYEVYFFAKLNLLRPCNLTPGQEVDHIIEGIFVRVVRFAARGQDCNSPENLWDILRKIAVTTVEMQLNVIVAARRVT